MNIPHTYAEWTAALEALKARKDDQELLAALRQGTLEWQTGVAERFAQRLTDAVNYRMNAASDKFQTEIKRASGDGAIVQALLSLRREMAFLYQVMTLPVIPEKDRQQYCQLVQQQADSMQQSLEESAKRDRSGKLASLIRNHKVNAW